MSLVQFSLKLVSFCLLLLSAHAADGAVPQDLNRYMEGAYNYDPLSTHGPYAWGSVSEEYAKCGTGMSQSPIDFSMKHVVSVGPLSSGPEFKVNPSELVFERSVQNWHSDCAAEGTCGYTKYNGTEYKFVGIHFHSPSENMLHGKRYPMEAHMVHSTDEGVLAVVAVFFDYPARGFPEEVYTAGRKESGAHSVVSEIQKGVLEEGNCNANLAGTFDPSKGFCTVTGSLTTPPCDEDVTWLVSLDIQTTSMQQVNWYKRTVGATLFGNNRPVKPIMGRKISCYV